MGPGKWLISYIIMVNMMYEHDLLTGLHVGSSMGQVRNNLLTIKNQ